MEIGKAKSENNLSVEIVYSHEQEVNWVVVTIAILEILYALSYFVFLYVGFHSSAAIQDWLGKHLNIPYNPLILIGVLIVGLIFMASSKIPFFHILFGLWVIETVAAAILGYNMFHSLWWNVGIIVGVRLVYGLLLRHVWLDD